MSSLVTHACRHSCMSSLMFRSALGRANVWCDGKRASFAGVEAYIDRHTLRG